MLVVTEWLQEYLSETFSANQMAQSLEAAGVEVEEVIYPPELNERIVAAKILQIKPHPEADKLSLAQVSDGTKEYSIVCGAPNIREGQVVPLAREGAVLPNGMEIEKTTIRGEVSEGMLCSAKELGLSEDHSGILELGPEVETGSPLADIYGSSYTVIDITTSPNRPDLLGYIGLAREIAAHTGTQLVMPGKSIKVIQGKSQENLFKNQLSDQVACYGLVKLNLGDGATESPDWMQRRLRLGGVKPISLVVDITNYVMLETGQPLHAFDAARVEGALEIRYGRSEESLTTLDGVERTLSAEDIVIADGKGALALAGIMGGESSEISNGTHQILLEAAVFNGVHVRKSAIRHGLRTEASARLEKGIPVQSVKEALRRACDLLVECAGAQIEGYQYELNVWPWVQHIGVRPQRLSRLAGMEIKPKEIVQNLIKLGFKAEEFDITKEAQKHLGKPYVWGAKFKTHGVEAFDCSYLSDYVYSLIGVSIGHTAYDQFNNGQPVEVDELKPGDLLFRGGPWVKLKEEERGGISHNAVYIGDGKIVDVRDYVRDDKGEWEKLPEEAAVVVEAPLSDMTEDPQYMGARRYAEGVNKYITVDAPWWRPDVRTEEDVLEEVIKLVGLDSVPVTLPKWQPSDISFDTHWGRLDKLRGALSGIGLFEVTTYPFVSTAQISKFGLEESKHLKLKNPRSVEQAYLRTTLAPNLLQAVINNTSYSSNFALFEIANVFLPEAGAPLPREAERLAVIVRSEEALLSVKNVVDQLASLASIDITVIPAEKYNFLHPGRHAVLDLGGRTVGFYGQLHPHLINKVKRGEVAYLELDLQPFLDSWQSPTYTPASKYPSSLRDITVKVPSSVLWGDIKKSIEESGLAKPSFLDEYYKGGERSLTIHLEMSDFSKTLTEEEALDRESEIIKVLKLHYDAKV